MPQVKSRGLLFTTIVQWLERNYSEELCNSIMESISPLALATLQSAEKSGWYPVEHLVEILRACPGKSDAVHRSCMDFGNYLCELSLSTSFKGLIVFIDPVTLIKRIPLFWDRYFDAGRMRADDVSNGKAMLRLEEPLGEETVTHLFSGWLEHALSMVGARNIEITGSQSHWKLTWFWTAG